MVTTQIMSSHSRGKSHKGELCSPTESEGRKLSLGRGPWSSHWKGRRICKEAHFHERRTWTKPLSCEGDWLEPERVQGGTGGGPHEDSFRL